MSEIHYVRSHRLPLSRAKAVAQKTADDLADQYDLVSEWEGDTLHFQRSGVDGHMHVSDREIVLHVKLGFLLRPFKARFEQHIERHLAELLEQAQSPAVAHVAKKARTGKSAEKTGSNASKRRA